MRVLALEPYYGGSHKAFLDGWASHSRHEFVPLTLPANKWKWRMRHAAITFAEQVARRVADGETWDVLFCSDMLNLAEFLGLAPSAVRNRPSVAYFHENQLTYPVRHEDPRDLHFGFTNFTTALAADEVWFNSQYHRDSFLAALTDLLARMPDHAPVGAVEANADKSSVHPPGIDPPVSRPSGRPGPIRILWAARWEHDKDPETFFDAIDRLARTGLPFRLDVLGESFRDVPAVFERARELFADRIDRWGYLPQREQYLAAVAEADVVVSTARHEFFGLGVVEAIAAGAYPLLPNRLAYPEILGNGGDEYLYDGGAEVLADRLAELTRRHQADRLWLGDPGRLAEQMARFYWKRRAPFLDNALLDLTDRTSK